VPVRARRRVEWVRGEQTLLPSLAARSGVDLVHSLASTAPVWGRFRRVVTIHDLAYRIVPEAHLGVAGLGMRVLVPGAAHRAHRIITDSDSTRADLLRFHRLDARRIDTVPLGVRVAAHRDVAPAADLRARLRLGDRAVLLSVSAQRPHKNLARLIEAVALLAPAQRPVLVVAGYETAYGAELRERAAALGVTDDVRIPGWLADRDLEGLYALAAAVACPSLYEGFGLPVLEAMARDVPVLTSDRGSLPEVAGDAALTVDPLDARAIAEGIGRLLTDTRLAGELRMKGRERVKRFTWAATAAGTLAAYERTLATGTA